MRCRSFNTHNSYFVDGHTDDHAAGHELTEHRQPEDVCHFLDVSIQPRLYQQH